MNPEMPHQPLADQPWFVDYLASKGFAKSSPTSFIRDQASLHVEGTELHADPGNGEKSWSTDFGDADRSTVKAMLEQILKMRPFLTHVDLAHEQIEKQGLTAERRKSKFLSVCRQLELIRSVYPSLYDIIVTNDQGTVIANARPERRSTLLGKNVALENWCQKSLKSGSNNTHIERAELKDEVHSAIVFSNPIRDPGDRQSNVLGTIAVFCDFQSEVGALLTAERRKSKFLSVILTSARRRRKSCFTEVELRFVR